MTQEFFSRLIAGHTLEGVNPKAGRFRSYLLASLNHVLANECDRGRALKRGGGKRFFSLDAEEVEGRFARETARDAGESPEKAFDRQWALSLLNRAFSRLRDEFTAARKASQFERLKVFLSEVAADGDYAALADPLGMDAGGVAVAVHRLRSRYREIVRSEIEQTVTTEADLQDEMRHLFAALS